MDGETSELLQNVLSVVLEGSTTSLATSGYYRVLASYVTLHDARIVRAVEDLAARVRAGYRSAKEHCAHVARVPVVKSPDRRVQGVLDTDCTICLKPLRGCKKIARLKSLSGSPTRCGHFFHAECVGEWELRAAVKQCPLCREPLGAVVGLWDDHESSVPRF